MPAVRAMLPAGKLHGASNEPCRASQTRVPERGSFKDSFFFEFLNVASKKTQGAQLTRRAVC